MKNDQDSQDTVQNMAVEAILTTQLWQGDSPLKIPVKQIIELVILYVLSKLCFELSLPLAQWSSPLRHVGLVLFLLSLGSWVWGTLILWKVIRQVGLRRLVLVLVISYLLLVIGMTLLSYNDQSLYQGVVSVAEQMLLDAGRLAKEVAISLIQAPGEFFHIYTSQPTLPGADDKTPGSINYPTRLLPVIEPTAMPNQAPSITPESAVPIPVITGSPPLADTPTPVAPPVGECPKSLPLLPPDCPYPQARLTAPEVSQVIEDEAQVMGTANIENLDYYKFEFRREDGEIEDEWHFVESFTTPVEEGVLGTWHVSHLPAGTYTFRLTVVDREGNYPFPPCDVQVSITH